MLYPQAAGSPMRSSSSGSFCQFCRQDARVRSVRRCQRAFSGSFCQTTRILRFVLPDGANAHPSGSFCQQRASSASFCPTVPTRILGFVFCQTTRILRFVLPDGANAHPSGSFCHTGPMRILGFVLPNAGGRGIARRADSRGLGRVRNETPTPHPNAPCWDSQARPTWRFSRTRVNALAPRADTMRKRRTRQAKKARRDFRPGFLCSSVRWAF